MPLVPETKMAEARKHSVLGTHWPGEPRGQCLKLCPHFNFVRRFWSLLHDKNFYKYFVFQHSFSFSHFHLQGQHTFPDGDGDVISPFIFYHGFKLNIEAYIKSLEKVVLPWIERAAAGIIYIWT